MIPLKRKTYFYYQSRVNGDALKEKHTQFCPRLETHQNSKTISPDSENLTAQGSMFLKQS